MSHCLVVLALMLAALLSSSNVAGQYVRCRPSPSGGVCLQVLTIFCMKENCQSCCQHTTSCNPQPTMYVPQSQCTTAPTVSPCATVRCMKGTTCQNIGGNGVCVPTNPTTVPVTTPLVRTTTALARPGFCPKWSGGFSTCPVLCTTDASCSTGEKCCQQGCSRKCVKACPATPCAIKCQYAQAYNVTTNCPECRCLTKCQSEQSTGSKLLGRRRRQLGRFVPQCATDGSYKRMQCHGSTGYCWCVNTATGLNTTQPVPPASISTLHCYPTTTASMATATTTSMTIASTTAVTHGGYCPRSASFSPVCRASCKSDGDCGMDSKCCSQGCNMLCVKSCMYLPCPLLRCTYGQAYNTTTGCKVCRCATKCEYTRDQALNGTSGPGPIGRRRRQLRPGMFVPRCSGDGSFEAMQCHASTGLCWCVDKQTGVNTTAKTRNLMSLPCYTAPSTRPTASVRPSQPTRSLPPRPTGSRPSRPTGSLPPRPTGSRPSRPTGSLRPRPTGSRPPQPTGSLRPRPTGSRPSRPTGSLRPRPTGSRPSRPTGSLRPRPTGLRPSRPTGSLRPRPTGSRPSRPTGSPPSGATQTAVSSTSCYFRPVCEIYCKYGLDVDSDGCRLCTCRAGPVAIMKKQVTFQFNNVQDTLRGVIHSSESNFASSIVKELASHYHFSTDQLTDVKISGQDSDVFSITFAVQGSKQVPDIRPFVKQLQLDAASGKLSLAYSVGGQAYQMDVANVVSDNYETPTTGSQKSGSSSNSAAIAGGVVGGVALIALIVLVVKVSTSDGQALSRKYNKGKVQFAHKELDSNSDEFGDHAALNLNDS